MRAGSTRLILVGMIVTMVSSNGCILLAGELKSFSAIVTESESEFVVETRGSLDPENVEITIENLGDTPIVDPRIMVNGKYDWFDIQSMADEITAGCFTDEEKAFAIWEWVLWKRFQRSPADDSSLNPVRAMNGYGYGICGHTAAWIQALCLKAGLNARVQEIWGHTVNEIYYDNAWHYFDGNVKVFYLGRDNRTVASIADLEKDRWLIERAIHPRDPWYLPVDSPDLNREMIDYIVTSRDNYIETGYDHEIAQKYTMSYTLKPGEKLVRWWKPVLNKHENRHNNPLAPELYANGQLIWEPDLDSIDVSQYIHVIENIATRQQDGLEPAIHVRDLHDRNYSRPSRFTIPIQSAYPIVGGRFWCSLLKDNGASISMSFGKPGWDQGDLYTYRWGSGTKEIEVDLDQKILSKTPAYRYEIGYTLKGNANTKPPAQSGVKWFKSVTDLQVSPHSLPALSLGKNIVQYRDGSITGGKVKITYAWREIDGNHAPGTITKSIPPIEFDTLTPVLQWEPAQEPDMNDTIMDYQVMVSLHPHCRWPVSTTLFRNVGSDRCEWKVPDGFLNPGTTYYWKVRGRDTRGAIGDWGTIFSFKILENAE